MCQIWSKHHEIKINSSIINLYAPAAYSVPSLVRICASIQQLQFEQKPSLQQLVLMPLRQLHKCNYGLSNSELVFKQHTNNMCMKLIKGKSTLNILLKASENSTRWSSVPWTIGCIASSCTDFSEFNRERASTTPFSCGGEMPFCSYRVQ